MVVLPIKHCLHKSYYGSYYLFSSISLDQQVFTIKIKARISLVILAFKK